MSRRLGIAVMLVAASAAFGQNVVGPVEVGPVGEPVRLAEADARKLIDRVPRHGGAVEGEAFRRVRAKLERHVAECVAGWPYRPLHHTHGISGYESFFGHPDEAFYALAASLPYLSEETAGKVKALLAHELKAAPPYREEGYAPDRGSPRERYDVPELPRAKKPTKAGSLFGVYAFWAYCHYTAGAKAAVDHWPAVKARSAAVLAKDYPFDPSKRDYVNDEAERLNGDLAGLIGLARLARLTADAGVEKAAVGRLRQLLELRVNLDRVNPRIVSATRSTTAHLHAFKMARHCGLVPELGEALARHTDGLAAKRLAELRAGRNAWWLAFGDRTVGGENYTNPPHVVRAMFAGAVLVERVAGDQSRAWVDVPWCKADWYFVEKCVLTLWSRGGDRWAEG